MPPPLQIFYPNGGTSASQMYVFQGGVPVAWDGSISLVSSGSAIEDGVNAAIKATVLALTNANPLTVAITDSNGDQITSFGGGVQYTEGDVDASVTGTAVMWRGAGNAMLPVDATNRLPVALAASTTVLGSVTINRTTPGTTNTVAIISGQDGIAGGTGVDGATVPRVTLATNVGLPAGSALIGKVGIDQTTPGTTNAVAIIAGQNGVTAGAGNVAANTPRVAIATDDINLAAINAVSGTTAGAAVVTDANGTIQQYLRGLIKGLAAGTWQVILGATSNLIGYVGNKRTYGNLTTLTTTNFSNLASGSGWQSAAIDAAGAEDIHFEFQTKGAAGSTLLVDFYIAETLANGTVYTDGATGSEGTFTAANRKNSRYLGSLQLNTTNAVQGCMKLKDIFAIIPKKFVIIAINNSSGTISSTGGDTVFDWAPVN